MKRIVPLNFIILVLFYSSVQAQSTNPSLNPSLANVVPPPPSVAALGKFGEIPIGYATGIPQINVPIFSYNNADKTLGMSISLDYHAGGVKVDEVASNVGIGWALNAGGAIMRSVRDLPDETQAIGFLNTPVLPEEFEGNAGWETSLFSRINAGAHDGQNDLFSFNFGGRSGQFMFGKNNDFLWLSPMKMKIEKEIGVYSALWGITKFTATDEKGVRYVFDAPEISGSNQPFGTCFSSWQLTKIIAPSSTDSITLEYETENPYYVAYQSASMAIFLGVEAGNHGSSSVLANNITGKRIKRINFPNNTRIDFAYDNTQRTDLQGTYRLKKITITDGVKERGYNLYHNYSVNRLTLLQVLPYDAAGEVPGYGFQYIGSLPNRLSYEQDHWGYYNSNLINTPYPHEYYSYFDQTGIERFELPGANREVDPVRVKYGSLSRITYPTGGYTEFDMEAHLVKDPRLEKEIIQRHSSRFFQKSTYCSSTTPGSITINGFQGDPNSVTQFKIYSFLPSYDCNGSNCYLLAELKNSSSQVINTQNIPLQPGTDIDHSFGVYNIPAGNYTMTLTAFYPENFGSYIDIEWTEVRLQNPDTNIIHDYRPYVGGLRVKSIRNYDNISTTPVSRIDYDYLKEDGATTSGTLGTYPQYSYKAYYTYEYDCLTRAVGEFNDYFPGSTENYLIRTSSPILTLGVTNGSPVNYSRVVERFENNGKSNGKIVRYFHSYGDNPLPEPIAYPCVPPDNRSWSYGQLSKELIYNKNDELLKKTINEYNITIDDYYHTTGRLENFTSVSLVPVKFQTMQPVSACHPGLPQENIWTYIKGPLYLKSKKYSPFVGREDLVKTRTVEFNGTDSLVNEVAYTYDTAFNINKTLTQNSRNEQIEEIVHYPYEYAGNTVANAMKAQNMYAPSIVTEKWKTIGSNKYLTGGMVNQYQQLASGIRKSSIESFENPSPVIAGSVPAFNPGSFNRAPSLFKEAITFNQYNNKGFVTQQAKANDAPQSIIWDHNQQYPIAQVIGSTADKIAYTSFEADGMGGWEVNPGSTFGNTQSYSGAKSFSGAIQKTVPTGNYTVTLWANTGGFATVNSQAGTPGITKGIWQLYTWNLTNVSVIEIASASMDEVRLFPQGAQMTTYTYDPLTGLTSQCDASNRITYYEYDGFGRLKTIRDQDKNVLKTLDYQYQKNHNQ